MGSGNAVENQEEDTQEGGGGEGEYEEFDQKGRNFAQKGNSFDLEDGGIHANTRMAADWGTVMTLAFQCIGVVYGDLGTSPLYVLAGIFPEGIKHPDDILGVLSLIIYSLLSIALIKYVFIVLAANDNGDGGTFALYSLISRYAKVNLIPNHQAEDRAVSNYQLEMPNRRLKMAAGVKSMLENSQFCKYFLLFTTMLGVSMVIGDGILTPCISVLSAVGGIKQATASLTDTTIMWISVVILIFLFQIQRFGTDRVAYTFAPILMMWFGFIASIGLYNFFRYDPSVIRAFNPWYIVKYFKTNKKDAWISLGGVILCLTGSEALFADLGHFNIRSIRLSSCAVLLPSILLAYFGQCSYLRRNPGEVADAFYKSIPGALYWPQFVLAVLAAVIASQSLISASFSIVQQSVALGCFPRVKVIHTSTEFEGQVYVPEINTFLMIACVGVTLGFKNTLKIGNAYGIAVAFVFVITSSLLILIMVMIWKTHFLLVILYCLTIVVIEFLFLSSVLYKFVDGGYLPLIFAFIMVTLMFTWSYGYRKKYIYELHNKLSPEKLIDIASDSKIHEVLGIGLFYSQLVQGITPIFSHYVASVPALHSVLVFVSIKSLPIGKVPREQRFLLQRVKPGKMIFRCFVRYGYKDPREDHETFEGMLVGRLKEFIRGEDEGREEWGREWGLVDDARRDSGVVYLMGEGEVMASGNANFGKKLVLDYIYNWLSRCVRQPDEVFLIPRRRMLKVGMTYEV